MAKDQKIMKEKNSTKKEEIIYRDKTTNVYKTNLLSTFTYISFLYKNISEERNIIFSIYLRNWCFVFNRLNFLISMYFIEFIKHAFS